MRIARLLLFAVITVSCQHKTVNVNDIESFVDNHLENNSFEIERIRGELKNFGIDTLTANILLLKELEQTHNDLIALNDSLNDLTNERAQELAFYFVEKHFQYNPGLFTHKDIGINGETPKSLLKLHLVRLETLFIYKARNEYDRGWGIRLDKMFAHIVPDKTMLKKGEKLTGHVFIGATASSPESNKLIKNLLVNGHEPTFENEGWKFEFTPSVNGVGLKKFELTAEFIWNGTTYKGHNVVYIEN